MGKPDDRRGGVAPWLRPTDDSPQHPPSSHDWRTSREWDSPWRKWGPYLSERQWGTVREDYSQDGDAWEYFTHDHARSRAYHWGEDGLAGFCDLKQRLCFALALWNGKDPILKERLFGLSNGEGNHGEDVKEYYFYLDSTPTHSYMKWLYKYPQAAFPVRRSRDDECAAARARTSSTSSSTPACSTTTATSTSSSNMPSRRRRNASFGSPSTNRGPETATIHLLPTLWFRNTWTLVARHGRSPTWRRRRDPAARASWRRLTRSSAIDGSTAMARRRCCSPRTTRTPSGSSTRPTRAPTSRTPFTRSSCTGTTGAVNPAETGTKAAAHYRLEVGAGQSVAVRLCLTDAPQAARPFAAFDEDARGQAPRGRRVLPILHAGLRQRGHRAGHAAGLRRPLLDEAVLLLRRQHVAPRARRESVRRRRRRSRPGTATGSTCSTTTSSRCRTSGSTRGTPPGISPFTRSR